MNRVLVRTATRRLTEAGCSLTTTEQQICGRSCHLILNRQQRRCNSIKSRTEAVNELAKKVAARLSEVSSFSPENQRYLGQPTWFTHPRLLRDNELMPGVSAQEFSDRRSALFDLVQMHQKSAKGDNQYLSSNGNIAILVPARETLYLAPDIPVLFRQDSNFLYLTGFREPGSVLLLHRASPSSHEVEATLFVSHRDPKRELWEGHLAGVSGAAELTGISNVLEHSSFWKYFAGLLSGTATEPLCLYAPSDSQLPTFYRKDFANFVTEHKGRLQLTGESPNNFIHKQRWRKSKSEVQLMRETCRIGAESLSATMRYATSNMEERLLASKMELESVQRGAYGLAYPCVVAGGDRANTIHYLQCDRKLRPYEMVLMDAGCDYHGYTSDITRCWSVSRTMDESNPQTELYEMLLEVQLTLLTIVENERPVTLAELYLSMQQLLSENLVKMGAIDKTLDRNQTKQLVNQLCPHHVGHYLGMDVHDTATVSRDVALEPNVVITVEPGIYIGKDEKRVAKEFRGIGLRIEDDVLITDTGADVLSEACPKSVELINELLD